MHMQVNCAMLTGVRMHVIANVFLMGEKRNFQKDVARGQWFAERQYPAAVHAVTGRERLGVGVSNGIDAKINVLRCGCHGQIGDAGEGIV